MTIFTPRTIENLFVHKLALPHKNLKVISISSGVVWFSAALCIMRDTVFHVGLYDSSKNMKILKKSFKVLRISCICFKDRTNDCLWIWNTKENLLSMKILGKYSIIIFDLQNSTPLPVWTWSFWANPRAAAAVWISPCETSWWYPTNFSRYSGAVRKTQQGAERTQGICCGFRGRWLKNGVMNCGKPGTVRKFPSSVIDKCLNKHTWGL